MTTSPTTTDRLALVTGATGYVGGELAGELLRRGWRVRVLTRSSDKLEETDWSGRVVDGRAHEGQAEYVEGDASDADDVRKAMQDVDVAYYLMHSMGEGDDFREQERRMAQTFASAAADADVSRIVYLGGLHPDDEKLSDHLASRVEVGRILIDSGVPTAVLQAGVVLGDDSASFVMLRHLSERLPGAIGPKWLKNEIQPIAVKDVMHYLVAAADLPADQSREFDIAGPDVVSYADMMKRYAQALGLGRRFFGVAPVTTPAAAARWIGLVTPVSSELARPLVESLLNDTVATEHDLADLVGEPEGGPTPFDEAVRTAAKGSDPRAWRRTLLRTGLGVAAAAAVGTIATDPNSRWYRRLDKPSWQPPAAAFPIVWTALYTDIAAISALTIADLHELDRDDERKQYIAALATNLVLNAGWTAAFFRSHRLPFATVVAAALAASSADLTRRAGKVDVEKGVALAPYAVWTGFATVLSAALARRNR